MFFHRHKTRSELRRSMETVTFAGTMGVLYFTLVMSPLATEFFRSLGADEFFFGMLGGIPMAMLFLQFPGALLANSLRARKPWFMRLIITSRCMFLGIAFAPALGLPRPALLAVLLVFLGLHGALMNLGTPMWYSWMADLVPPRVLNTYWGHRQSYIQTAWVLGFVGLTVLTYFWQGAPQNLYPWVITFAVASGVTDILLFLRVREPENAPLPSRPVLEVLIEPLRHREYRPFVIYSAAWLASVVVAENFMLLYVLKMLGMQVWQTMLTWCVLGVGCAFASRSMGRLADRHGHKPILILCGSLKPLICLVFIFVTPENACWVLPLAFLPDGVLNAGMLVASNGFMLKLAPKQNRSMFIAALTGLSGIAAGIASLGAGHFLTWAATREWVALGREWNHFQLAFAISLCMRALCLPLAIRLREPASSTSAKVLYDLVGLWPARFLRFPVGMYRRIDPLRLRSRPSDASKK